MSLGSEIARHIPYLRRYARGLTGSQLEGDGYVRATLEALVESPGRFDQSLPARVALYSVFHEVWSNGPAIGRARQARGGGISDRLTTLASSRRQALLLTAMEGFSRED